MSFVEDKHQFEDLKKFVTPYCTWDTTLDEEKKIYYGDWNEFRWKGYFPFLEELIKISGDKEIYFYTLRDKASEETYIKHFNKYPMIKIKVPFTENEFYQAIDEKPGEQILGYSYELGSDCTYILFPDTFNWYIYGEYDIELSKLVTNLKIPEVKDNIPFFYSEEKARREHLSFL